jgi:hypothetical protein
MLRSPSGPPKDAGASAEKSRLSQSTGQITPGRFPVFSGAGAHQNALQSGMHPRLDPAFGNRQALSPGEVLKRDGGTWIHFPSFLLLLDEVILT